MMLGDKYLYQIGDGRDHYYLFNQAGLRYTIKTSFKAIRETAPYFHGSSRINGDNSNLKSDYIMSLSFVHKDDGLVDINYINRFFLHDLSKPKKIFFYEKEDGNITKYFYNYVELNGNFSMDLVENRDTGLKDRRYSVELMFSTPFFFECDDELKYFNKSNFENGNVYWSPIAIPNQNNYWGTTTVYWGQTYLSSFPKISTLTQQAQTILFDKIERDVPLSLKDRFFKQEIKDLDTLNSYGLTLTNNSKIYYYLGSDSFKTTAESRIYLIKFNPLTKGETIRIANLTNDSDILITWVGDSPNTNDIVFNSYFCEFFDVVTGKQITYNSINYTFTLDQLLYSEPSLTINPYIRPFSQTFLFQKNTASDNTITIQNLNTYN